MIDVHVSRLDPMNGASKRPGDELQDEQRGVGEEDDQPDAGEPADGKR